MPCFGFILDKAGFDLFELMSVAEVNPERRKPTGEHYRQPLRADHHIRV